MSYINTHCKCGSVEFTTWTSVSWRGMDFGRRVCLDHEQVQDSWSIYVSTCETYTPWPVWSWWLGLYVWNCLQALKSHHPRLLLWMTLYGTSELIHCLINTNLSHFGWGTMYRFQKWRLKVLLWIMALVLMIISMLSWLLFEKL